MFIKLSDSVQKAYDYTYDDVLLGWRDIGAFYKACHIIDLCQANNIRPKKILDYGAGCGSLLKHFSEMGFGKQYYAVDISDKSVAMIQQRGIRGLADVQRFDGYTTPFANLEFDLVVLSHVLEHVEYERLVLREIKRVAPIYCIEVPLDYSPYVDKKVDHFLSYGHINVYTPVLLRFLLGTEGFEVLDDIPDLYGDGIREYQRFVLGNQPDTPEARVELSDNLRQAREAFEKLNPAQKEAQAHNYTVLCRDTGQGLTLGKSNA